MFKSIFLQIWKNIYIRITLISFLCLIVFLLIFKIRYSIYNTFYKSFRGATYDDPYTWQGDVYGFQEQPEAALSLYIEGIEDLIDEAADIYNQDEPEIFNKKKMILESEWQQALTTEARTLIEKLFYDMNLYCDNNFVSTASMRSRWMYEERLKKRHLKESKASVKNPFAFALTKDKYNSIHEDLLNLDFDNFSLAQQKKPDAIAILTLRSQIYENLCRPSESSTIWEKAIDYYEFKTEKILLFNKNEPSHAIVEKVHPDALYAKLQLQLKADSKYHRLLKNFFLNSFRSVANINWKLKISEEIFSITNDKEYANRYLEIALEYSRISSIESNKKNFKKLLYEIDYKNIEFNPLYIYTLAEVAFRSGYYKKSRRLVSHITKQGLVRKISQTSFLQNAQRLNFMLDLMNI